MGKFVCAIGFFFFCFCNATFTNQKWRKTMSLKSTFGMFILTQWSPTILHNQMEQFSHEKHGRNVGILWNGLIRTHRKFILLFSIVKFFKTNKIKVHFSTFPKEQIFRMCLPNWFLHIHVLVTSAAQIVNKLSNIRFMVQLKLPYFVRFHSWICKIGCNRILNEQKKT